MFAKYIKKIMDVYIDDMLIKNMRVEDHIKVIPKKSKAILKINSLRSIKDVQCLTRKIAALKQVCL